MLRKMIIPPPHSLRELTLGEWKQYQHSHNMGPEVRVARFDRL